MKPPPSHPIVSCDAARRLEEALFHGNEALEWAAMQKAGRSIAAAIRHDFEEIGGLPGSPRILVLVGKGHNGGDALLAARVIADVIPPTRVDVLFVFGETAMRPLARRAWRETQQGSGRGQWTNITNLDASSAYDVCLDGVFGFQFHAPADARVSALLERANALSVRLRAAVDLPSAGLFRADFTYATGSVKLPIVEAAEAGRVRYLDLGFFEGDSPGEVRVLTSHVLAPLAALRTPASDKRRYGHVFIVGGSHSFPGAVLMTVLAALRSGAGLVTAFVPESVAPAFAARAPEAMWVGWPETPDGGLALEGEHLLQTRIERADALVVGPGLGREKETLALIASIVKASRIPVVIDADALQPEIVTAGSAARIVTPHAGEFARIAGGAELRAWVRNENITTVLKGPVTKVASSSTVCHSFFGGPVLARGGSGDLLAGLIGGLLAQLAVEAGPAAGDSTMKAVAFLAAARGVVWHGMAADLLARAHGQTAVSVTQLLDFLPAALRESAHE